MNRRWLRIAITMLLAIAMTTYDAAATTMRTGDLDATTDARRAIAGQMEALGSPAVEATQAASLLTPADLAVLQANPRMMQRAGGMSQTSKAILLGILIIAGIVALGAASDSGSASFSAVAAMFAP